MGSRYDVVVVGARCAGSPMATLLARAGLDVAVVEKATFPRDTMSTHIFEADGVTFLDRLGLSDQLRATGSPQIKLSDNLIGDVRAIAPWPKQPSDAGTLMSIRRFVLDPILADAAKDAGADLRMATTVTGLVEEGGRVAGVRVRGSGGEEELRARLVVGADGRNSTVARLTGARKYNVVPSELSLYWGYYEGVEIGEPTFAFHQLGDHTVVGCPTDSGLYQVQVFIEPRHLPLFRGGPEAALTEFAMHSEPVAAAIGGAKLAGKVLGMVRWEGFFRDASGPGWVLVGDAGHFKDPSPGRGIGDAFLQVDRLAPAIASALDGTPAAVDEATEEFVRWRDEEFFEHYWFAQDMGRAGPPPAVLVEMLRRFNERGEAGLLMEIINHRIRPSELITPPRILRATAQALKRNRGHRLAVLREVADQGANELRRRRLRRRPEYVADESDHADAGPTEVEPHLTAA